MSLSQPPDELPLIIVSALAVLVIFGCWLFKDSGRDG